MVGVSLLDNRRKGVYIELCSSACVVMLLSLLDEWKLSFVPFRYPSFEMYRNIRPFHSEN